MDRLTNWEAEIIHNLKILKAQKAKLSPVLWPRDTMFQHFMLLEALASNLDERDAIYKLLGMLYIASPLSDYKISYIFHIS